MLVKGIHKFVSNYFPEKRQNQSILTDIIFVFHINNFTKIRVFLKLTLFSTRTILIQECTKNFIVFFQELYYSVLWFLGFLP